jgi:phage terminase large subunit-like protein
MQSPADRLAELPKAERKSFLSSLSEEEAAALLYEWRRFHARPDQIAPEGDWDIWLILSGRGWGKTRTGAEWIKEQAEGGHSKRIALVAETAADARDVMVEGESGILSLYPEDQRPLYEPSKRRVTWKNGAQATLYNATEPDQLRGPQHDAAWCFVAGTMITTKSGAIPIEEVVPGSEVLTRKGWCRVSAASKRLASVGSVGFSHKESLVGTPDHPVYTKHGWTRMDQLELGDTVCVTGALSGAGSYGTHTAVITSERTKSAVLKQFAFTVKSGLAQTGRFLRDMTSTISMVTRQTMRSAIWSAYPSQGIGGTTLRWSGHQRSTGAKSPLLRSSAFPVAVGSSGREPLRRCAKAANTSELRSGERFSSTAATVKRSSDQGPETFAASVVSTWQPQGQQNVYCLKVEAAPEYFANRVLVHNCDELAKWRYARETWDQLQFGLRLGKHPQQIVTTTPRPIELVKAIVNGKEGKVEVTRGRTADNRSNLARTFLAKIEERYSGTRLGRQELDGEILGDMPGALWSLDQIDVYRVKEAPELSRIVVAIDPAVTNTENSDEHGIMVVGVSGKDGYVLEDGSLPGSPLTWARRAVALYDKYDADAIVAEVNQGGDMVKQTLRTVRSGLPVIEVRATRGKHVRAAPIAALYEQGRMHHVGSFPQLEEQMTLTTNAGYEGENSPDRLDALVWAATNLFPSVLPRKPVKKNMMQVGNGGWMSR